MTDLHAYLSYRDPETALTWLTHLGYPVAARVHAADGSLQHAEVPIGSGLVMICVSDDDYEPPRLRRRSVGYGLYLAVDDVDSCYETALAAGSRPVLFPEDAPWGGRRARVLDPGGYEWSFGSRRVGSSPLEDSSASSTSTPSR